MPPRVVHSCHGKPWGNSMLSRRLTKRPLFLLAALAAVAACPLRAEIAPWEKTLYDAWLDREHLHPSAHRPALPVDGGDDGQCRWFLQLQDQSATTAVPGRASNVIPRRLSPRNRRAMGPLPLHLLEQAARPRPIGHRSAPQARLAWKLQSRMTIAGRCFAARPIGRGWPASHACSALAQSWAPRRVVSTAKS